MTGLGGEGEEGVWRGQCSGWRTAWRFGVRGADKLRFGFPCFKVPAGPGSREVARSHRPWNPEIAVEAAALRTGKIIQQTCPTSGLIQTDVEAKFRASPFSL